MILCLERRWGAQDSALGAGEWRQGLKHRALWEKDLGLGGLRGQWMVPQVEGQLSGSTGDSSCVREVRGGWVCGMGTGEAFTIPRALQSSAHPLPFFLPTPLPPFSQSFTFPILAPAIRPSHKLVFSPGHFSLLSLTTHLPLSIRITSSQVSSDTYPSVAIR